MRVLGVNTCSNVSTLAQTCQHSDANTCLIAAKVTFVLCYCAVRSDIPFDMYHCLITKHGKLYDWRKLSRNTAFDGYEHKHDWMGG